MIFQNKSILVTGGTGSMGSAFVRRVLSGKHGTPRKLTVFSRDEAKQHEMRMEYLHRTYATDEIIYQNFSRLLQFTIGDVRDFNDVSAAAADADIIVNAAALKQVPTCEYFPDQATLTNVMGAINIVRAIERNRLPVQAVVGVSTDKACKPVNVMGMTKAIQERIFVAANLRSHGPRFVCVRYGNVLGSRGSVIPLFLDQIARGGPLTVTNPEMTRFLLGLEDAVDTVIAALEHAAPGEIFVPDAPSATVGTIARALIGDRRIALQELGARPGEKMHEVMISEEEVRHCVRRGAYYAIRPMLPELGGEPEPNALEKELSSADKVLSLGETASLLGRHGLLPSGTQGR